MAFQKYQATRTTQTSMRVDSNYPLCWLTQPEKADGKPSSIVLNPAAVEMLGGLGSRVEVYWDGDTGRWGFIPVPEGHPGSLAVSGGGRDGVTTGRIALAGIVKRFPDVLGHASGVWRLTRQGGDEFRVARPVNAAESAEIAGFTRAAER